MVDVEVLGHDPAMTGDQILGQSRCHRRDESGSWKSAVDTRP